MAKSLVSCFFDSQRSFVAANQYCHDDDTRDQGTKILCVKINNKYNSRNDGKDTEIFVQAASVTFRFRE